MTTLRSGGGGGGGGKQDLECDNPGPAIQTKLSGKNDAVALKLVQAKTCLINWASKKVGQYCK